MKQTHHVLLGPRPYIPSTPPAFDAAGCADRSALETVEGLTRRSGRVPQRVRKAISLKRLRGEPGAQFNGATRYAWRSPAARCAAPASPADAGWDAVIDIHHTLRTLRASDASDASDASGSGKKVPSGWRATPAARSHRRKMDGRQCDRLDAATRCHWLPLAARGGSACSS